MVLINLARKGIEEARCNLEIIAGYGNLLKFLNSAWLAFVEALGRRCYLEYSISFLLDSSSSVAYNKKLHSAFQVAGVTIPSIKTTNADGTGQWLSHLFLFLSYFLCHGWILLRCKDFHQRVHHYFLSMHNAVLFNSETVLHQPKNNYGDNNSLYDYWRDKSITSTFTLFCFFFGGDRA